MSKKKNEMQLLDKAAVKYSISNHDNMGQFERMFALGEGIRTLNDMITKPMMEKIMYLQGQPLGFRTDMDPTKKNPNQNGYPVEKVKPIFIEAVLRGLPPVGNCFNIISDRLYITKEGFKHILKNYPGLTDLKYTMEPPVVRDKRTIVDFESTWKMNGQQQTLCGSIPITTNAYSTPDQILGKGERKLLYRVHAEVTGSVVSEFEERDESEFNNTQVKTPAQARLEELQNDSSEKTVEAEVQEVKEEPPEWNGRKGSESN